MELHHDPFLSFALGGYNHEWYGTVHAHHYPFPYAWKISSVDTAYTILSRLDAGGIIICGICSHSHPCSQRIIHGCIQALPYRISVYRKQTGNSETMTSDQRGIHGTATIKSDTWRHRFHMPSSQRRIEQDEHDPGQFCSSTYVDIVDNNRKSQVNPLPAFHMLSLTAS